MTRDDFRELLKIGSGRAIVYARDNDVGPFQDVILDACLHCYSFDVQCEGTRAGFMFELVNLLPDRQYYRDAVLAALPSGGDDDDAAQRFYLAMNFALDGDAQARNALYDSFSPRPINGAHMAISFIQLDGLSGFLYAAAKIGELLVDSPVAVEVDWLWSKAMETCGEPETRIALSETAGRDPRIAAFQAAVEAGEAAGWAGPDTSRKIRGIKYAQLRKVIAGTKGSWLIRWGREASDTELSKAAQGLVAAEAPEELIQHLRIFASRPYPLDPSAYVELALSADEDLAHAAAVALAEVTHPSIRDLAFRLVRDRHTSRKMAADMLARNWSPNDHEVVLSWLAAESDPDVRHGIGSALLTIWERQPDPASEVRMLTLLYEKGPCSCCRERVVHRLMELNALSESMRAECAYDANSEVRQLVGAE